MKIHFLGTGAADWNVENDRDILGFRRNSSILINDTLLVDPGACIFEFEQTFGYENLYKGVKNIVCTHKHSDHYNPDTVSRLGLEVTELSLFEPTEVGEFIITALPANHSTAEDPRHLIIEEKSTGKRFFYGLDGAWLKYETAKYMRQFKFDIMLFDATLGNKDDLGGILDYRIFEHNSLEMAELLCNTFKPNCSLFYISHMAKTLHRNHEALSAYMAPKGIYVAYDNHVVNV